MYLYIHIYIHTPPPATTKLAPSPIPYPQPIPPSHTQLPYPAPIPSSHTQLPYTPPPARLASTPHPPQPICSFDWSPDKEGLAVMGVLDQTVRVLICTKLNTL